MKQSTLELMVEYTTDILPHGDMVEKYGETTIDLLKMYFNDKNSSTMRERVMCHMLGIESNDNKLGYDGNDGAKEMKPKNHDTTNPKSKKLNGAGNYSDMTHKRHQKFIDDNAEIYIGGFVDGRIVYIIKVPYVSLEEHFSKQIFKNLPNGDELNKYLRSMTFSLTHYKNMDGVEVVYLTDNLDSYSTYLTKDLYTFLNQ